MSLEVRVSCVCKHNTCDSSKLERGWGTGKIEKKIECCACKLHGSIIGNNQPDCGVRAHLVSGDSYVRHTSAVPAQLPTKDNDNCSFVIKVVS